MVSKVLARHVATTLFSLFIGLATADAATIKVISDADSGPGTLRDSIQLAVSGDKITFSSKISTIVLTSQIVIDKDLSISGSDVTISGGQVTRIFAVTTGVAVDMKQLSLIDGLGVPSAGAIFNEGTLALKDMKFKNNTAPTSAGGAIDNRGTLSIDNCKFRLNTADSGGGAIINQGEVAIDIKNSTFTENSAPGTGGNGAAGGAIDNRGGVITIKNSTFSNNFGLDGGGAVFNNTNTYTVKNCTFTQNRTGPNGRGGAILNFGTFSLKNSSVTENAAGVAGGGIFNDGVLTLMNTDVKNNTPDDIAP